jgi:sRNA-binding carbon storage regulator CsrA
MSALPGICSPITTSSGKEIKILITDAFRGPAKLGIDALSNYEIIREELLETG